MRRQDMNELLLFVAVAQEKSFTKAAAKLGTSQSTLSHTIKELESRLGLRLLMRTTRSVSPTEAGERLLRTLVPHIADIENELDAVMAYRTKPSGTVRITLSDHAADWIVWPKLKPVLQAYPDIKLELSIDNGFRNIVEHRFDAGVRLGESLDKDMIAVRIGPDWRMVAVASPDYIATRGAPDRPQELAQHNCINQRHTPDGGLYVWEFAKDGRDLRIRVEGQLTFSSSAAMVEGALAGFGIAYVPENMVTAHIEAGTLLQVLDDWSPRFTGYYLYYPSRRQNAPAFSIIIDALRQSSAEYVGQKQASKAPAPKRGRD